MKIEILGVKIDQVYIGDVLNKVSDFLSSDSQHYIVTVNPEFVVEAQRNKEFKRVLNGASIATCDGAGLVMASGGKLHRVTGVELSQELLKLDWLKIFLLGGNENSAKKLANQYPDTVVDFERGGKVNKKTWLLSDNEKVIKKINKSGANVVLVGFGQVKQEMWIEKNLSQMKSVKLVVGVGGTFDYLSGEVERAPKWMRELGLEWFYRLLTQPQRIGRILNATFVFLWMLIFKRK